MKKGKKWLFILVSALLLLIITSFFIAEKWYAKIKPHENEQEGAEPDFSGQYLLMKQNEQGFLPRMDFDVLKAQQEKLIGNENLLNVKQVGPYNRAGRTRAFLIDNANHSHFIAGGASGGIWETYNKGLSWRPIDDHAPCMVISCITQDLDPSIIYYATGENSGNSSGLPGDGVYRSTDGGKSFSRLSSTLSPAFDNVISIKSSITTPNLLFIGTADSGLYRSTNAGLTVSRMLWNGTFNIEDIEVFKDGSVIVCVNSTGIYRSPNGNPGTFVKVTGGLPTTGFKKILLAYCDSFPNVMYASFENSAGNDLLGVWKTTDGGTTWTQTTTPSPGYYYFPSYAMVLDVKPDNPNYVVSGCVYMDYTTNGGTSWNNLLFSGADDHTVVFDPENPAIFYIGHDAGISKYNSATGGSAYSMLNKGYYITQFYSGAYFPTGISFIGGTQDNSTEACRNNDSVFQLIDPYNGDGFYTQVNQQNPNIAYLAWQYGAIRKATNALVNYPTFTSCLNEMDANASGGIDDGGWTVNPFSMNMLDGNQLYIATLKRVWRTVNSATNWTPLTNILNGDGNSPYCVGISNALNPTVYIGGQQLKFYRVDNAATAVPGSEVNIRASAPSIIKTSFISNIVVHPNNDSIVYVSLSSLSTNPRLWKVTGAKTNNPVWTSISGDLPSGLPVNWIEVDPSQPDKVFIVATDYGLYTTVNGGVNWSHEMAIPDAPIPMVKVRASDRKLFIFTHGRSVWVADLPSITTSVAEHLSAKSGLVIFPNPATHNLNFNLTGSSSVEIFDQAGKLLLRKQVENFVDLENIPTGVYFIKLENNGTAYRKRFVKF